MKKELTDFIRIYPNVLRPEVCEHLIDFFEQHQDKHTVNGGGRHYHLGENSRWQELNLMPITDDHFKQTFARIMADYKIKYEQDCGIPESLPAPSSVYGLRMKRYDVNSDAFVKHMDAYGPSSNRFLVYLWYLNDVQQGGETEFADLGITAKPEQGSLVMFPPYWMYMHEAKTPISNPKYIINTFYQWD